MISTDGVSVDPKKVSIIKNWKVPESMRGVHSFLGFCNFYKKFIKDYGRIARPLNNLTKKDILFVWSDSCEQAF